MITKQQIEHIANLARLSISEEEKEGYASDLTRILDYFEKLEKVDTSGVIPIKQITGLKNKTRNDEFSEDGFSGQGKILNNAPLKKDKFIKVKSVL